MTVVDHAKQAKHLLYVVNKRSRRALKKARFDVATRLFRDLDRVWPYTYDPTRYDGTFLSRAVHTGGEMKLPRRVFAIWAGDNELTENRARNLDRIRATIGLPLVLVTPDDVDDWLVDGSPLHPAYEHLSLIHRSDYLRGYLMHHHGGAYVDIKQPLGSWADPFDAVADDPDAWVCSYSSSHANWIGKLRGRLGTDILLHYRLMFGKGAFIMRSHTPLTAEWMAEMDRRLDLAADELRRHAGGVFGDDPAYPISWTDLLGRVLDPLTLKYLPHVRYDERMLLNFENYR